ncbi:hypothetical protein IEQ34_010909 [Dendrobium chrysotoxum]|uniref:Uncharacterized protein n=1 Tax=Dendrobium chrysotoxum TaxID=161865 RepID=A0AAV7GU35_DENCH|nr:hypothetical protein IEQ34_010909 [Dendrobium chrysotoxum]
MSTPSSTYKPIRTERCSHSQVRLGSDSCTLSVQAGELQSCRRPLWVIQARSPPCAILALGTTMSPYVLCMSLTVAALAASPARDLQSWPCRRRPQARYGA